MKKVTLTFLIMILVQSCFPSFKLDTKDRLYLKEIQDKSVKLEWFYYSSISTITPDYVTIQKGRKIDTICVANNIANLKLEESKIIIGFYGPPKRYMKPIELPNLVMGYQIIKDTSYINSDPVIQRNIYKER